MVTLDYVKQEGGLFVGMGQYSARYSAFCDGRHKRYGSFLGNVCDHEVAKSEEIGGRKPQISGMVGGAGLLEYYLKRVRKSQRSGAFGGAGLLEYGSK